MILCCITRHTAETFHLDDAFLVDGEPSDGIDCRHWSRLQLPAAVPGEHLVQWHDLQFRGSGLELSHQPDRCHALPE